MHIPDVRLMDIQTTVYIKSAWSWLLLVISLRSVIFSKIRKSVIDKTIQVAVPRFCLFPLEISSSLGYWGTGLWWAGWVG